MKWINKLFNLSDKEKTDKEEKVSATSDEAKKEKERKWADLNEDVKFVCESGKVMCKYCSNPIGNIAVTSNTISLQDKPCVTARDNNGKANLVFDGVCNHPSHGSKKPPCQSVIQLAEWTDTSETIIGDNNALLVKSKVKCLISG